MVQVGSVRGRLAAGGPGGFVDVQRASGGRFAADPQAVYERWHEFREWWRSDPDRRLDPDLRPDSNPLPRARQVFAVGMNSTNKRAVQHVDAPPGIAGVAKFATSLAGPFDPIPVEGGATVLDVEVGLVIGEPIDRAVEEAAVPGLLAGAVLGLDVVDTSAVVRLRMGATPVSYLNPGKSRPGFAPLGPIVVGLDEVADPAAVDVALDIDGARVQEGSPAGSLFGPFEVIARLSRQMDLLPGDVVLLGGVGNLPGVPVLPLRPGTTVVAGSSLLGRQRHTVVRSRRGVAAGSGPSGRRGSESREEDE